MSELKMVSPLLDRMTVLEEISGREGCHCYALRHEDSGERYVVKHISIPAAEKQIYALLLSGAYPDQAAVHTYYGTVADSIRDEVAAGQKLAESGFFLGAKGCQIEPKESGVGYDVYILYPRQIPLSTVIAESAMTNLRAVNLGLDLCDALSACRQAGYLFSNLKPENVFLTQSGRFQLGDLGLTALEDLQYASVPEEYLGPYAAPELSDIMASPNPTIDLYSLGMLLYRIYNGNHGPFEDEHTEPGMADKLRLTGKAMPTPLYADYELSAIILKACAPSVEARYQTPEELKQALMYYMQRNELSDTLIVPPIVTSPLPVITDEAEEKTDEPVRFNVEQDETFRQSFAPDLSGAGTDADIDETAPQPAPEPTEEPAPAEEAPSEDPAEPEEVVEAEPISKEEAEEEDPNQIDLDAFLASLGDVVADDTAKPEDAEEPAEDAEAAPVEAYVDATPTEEEAEEPAEPGKRKLPFAAALSIILGVVLLFGAALYFLLNWYFVRVTSLRVVSSTTEQFVLAVDSKDNPSHYLVTCTDSHGVAYSGTRSGNEYTFTGLQENTIYTVSLRAAGRHRLSGASVSELNVTTPESTLITDFTSMLGDEEGSVILTLAYTGPAPVEWLLTYTDSAGGSNSASFTGASTTITGLSLNQKYTFTLESTDGIYLSGATSTQIDVLPLVKISSYSFSEISAQSLTLNWTAAENTPSSWQVTCEAQDFTTVTATVTEPTFSTAIPDLSREYKITINAPGMAAPLVCILPANPVVVSGLSASASADGSVQVSWNTLSGAPAGGWYVSYGATTSYHDPAIKDATENAVTLTNLIPDATYKISLQPADGSEVFGTIETTVTTPGTDTMDAYGVSPGNTYISLWEKPSGDSWNYLSLSNSKSTFAADEDIALCLQVSGRNNSTNAVQILYVIRDADGNPVSDASDSRSWNDMWYQLRHTSTVPNPGKAGDYTLEVYVDHALLKRIAFTIS